MGRPPGGSILPTFGLTLCIVLGVATVAAAVCTVTIGDFDGNGSSDLRVVGDDAAQTLIIRDHPGINQAFIELDCNGNGILDPGDLDGSVGHLGGFEVIDIRLGGGDDRVTIEVPSFTRYIGKNRNFVVDLGPGANRFRFEHPGVDDFEFTAENSRITMDVRGGAGADDVGFTFKGAIASMIVLRADLAGGPDVIELVTSGGIARYEQGSIVDIEFQLGAGNDRVTYHPTADPVDGSVYRVRIVGDAGADVVGGGIFSLVGNNALLLLGVDLGAGHDRLTLSPPPLVDDLGTVHIDVAGGDGHDVLSIEPSSVGWTSRLGGRVEMFVHGNDGNDEITVNVSPDIGSEVSGLIRVHADGGAGNDRVLAAVEAVAESTGQYDFLLRGGMGNDDLRLTVLNAGANLPENYPPVGASLLDGGAGTDECKAVGIFPVWKQNCETLPPPVPTD
jgi:hypothetical protein